MVDAINIDNIRRNNIKLFFKLIYILVLMINDICHIVTSSISGFILNSYNLLFTLITLDSIFSAINFLRIFVNSNLTESQIVISSNQLYTSSTIDRYIYYFLTYVTYKTVCTFFWVNECNALYSTCIISTIPLILNKLSNSILFFKIMKVKELLVKIIISKIFATIIKAFSKFYLERDINVKHTEILILLDDYTKTIGYFIITLKNIIIIIGLSYVKNYSAPMYYSIIKYIYNYKTGELLKSYNIESAKHYLISKLENREWNELTKPNTYRAMLYLCQTNNDKSDCLRQIVNEFNYSMIKMFTVWTIAGLFESVYTVPFISLCLLLYKKTECMIHQLFIITLATIISYVFPNYLIISVICQFGANIMFNKLTFIMAKIAFKKIKRLIYKIILNNSSFLMSYIASICYALILRHIESSYCYVFIALNVITNICINGNVKKQLIFVVIISSTYASNYDVLHISFNSIVIYVTFGLLNVTSNAINSLIFYAKYYKWLAYKYICDMINYLYQCWISLYVAVTSKLSNNKYSNSKQLSLKLNNNAITGKNMVTLDDDVFNRNDNDFINDISIDSSMYEIEKYKDNVYLISDYFNK